MCLSDLRIDSPLTIPNDHPPPHRPGRSLLSSCSSDCYGTTCEEWDTNYGTDPTQCDWLASWGDINSDCDCSGCACDPPDPTSAPTTAAAPTPDPTVSEVPTTLPTPLPTLVPTTTLSPTTCWVVECGKVREVSGGAKLTRAHTRAVRHATSVGFQSAHLKIQMDRCAEDPPT